MAAHLLDFLKKKYIDEFKAAPGSKLVRCPELLKEISADIEKKSFKHDKIHEAIDLLYDLNNSLEDCMTFEETTPGVAGRKNRCSWRGIRRDCDATKNKFCNERNTRAELEKLRCRLAEIKPASTEKPSAEASSISVIKREGFPYFDKSEVFCFDVPLEFLKDVILPENQHNVAMAFVGIGGSGKSTLARMIFLDEGVQKKFDDVLWVDCSKVSHHENKLSCITVEKFRHTASPCRYTLEEALRSLHGIIRDRRFLVVLDGLWTSEGTKTFVDVVTQHLRGTVIITTRLNGVAKDLVGENNIFYSDNFWASLSERAKKEEGSGEEKDGAGAKREEKEKQIQEHCWLVFEETLKRKKFGDIGGIELHRDIRLTELEEVIKRGSLGNPLAAKTLAEVISQRLHKTGYWAEEKEMGSINGQKDEHWEFLLKVDAYDHLSLSKAWYRVLSTADVVKEKSYYRKNEFIVTSTCHPRDVLRSLRDVCHVEFISIMHTKTQIPTN